MTNIFSHHSFHSSYLKSAPICLLNLEKLIFVVHTSFSRWSLQDPGGKLHDYASVQKQDSAKGANTHFKIYSLLKSAAKFHIDQAVWPLLCCPFHFVGIHCIQGKDTRAGVNNMNGGGTILAQ